MPRPAPPPTPGSSSDLRGKEGTHTAPAFTLPPSSFQDIDRASTSSSPQSNNGSDSSYHPVSPGAAPVKRPLATGGVITKEDFALPPPPTRSRKIIQMKPRESDLQEQAALAGSALSGQNAPKTSQQAGKRKQTNSTTTAAGRKIARKTAHSLIERRRRSKMNEEFGVLKDMIPACQGQEMHKLAILQASIEYLRYLEQCVQDLQAQNSSPRQIQPPPLRTPAVDDENNDEDEEMEDDNDREEGPSAPATNTLHHNASGVSLPSLSQMTSTTSTSPSIFSNGAGRQYSISSSSQTSFSPYIHSNQASPAFGPQLHQVSTAPAYTSVFGIGSPALKPVDQLRQIAEGATELSEKRAKHGRTEHEQDQEATAALLMLNNDRRQWRAIQQKGQDERRSGTGMSVRDLLIG